MSLTSRVEFGVPFTVLEGLTKLSRECIARLLLHESLSERIDLCVHQSHTISNLIHDLLCGATSPYMLLRATGLYILSPNLPRS